MEHLRNQNGKWERTPVPFWESVQNQHVRVNPLRVERAATPRTGLRSDAQSCTLAEIRGRNSRQTNRRRPLTVSGYGAHLTGEEVVRRPWTGYEELAILELLGGGAVAVLIFLDRLGVDEVGDIEQHAVGIDLLAADFFLEGVEELMHLDGEGSGFGLAFALTGRLFAQLGQVLAADRIGQDDVFHVTAERAVANHQLDAHFGLAAQPLHALAESAAVGPDSLTNGIFGVENGSEAEGQDGGGSEALADYAGMLQNRLFVEFAGGAVIFTDNHREFSARVAHDGSGVHTLNTIQNEGTTGPNTVG